MSTGQNIIDEIRDELQDTTDLSFGTAELLRYINRGAKEFCATTGCLDTVINVDTNGASVSYDLVGHGLTNPINVLSVHFAGIPLYRTYLYEISYEYGVDSGTPTTYLVTISGTGKIAVRFDYIPPAASGGDDALRIWYLRTPTDMSAVSSNFDFPDQWDSAIVQYAIARCHHSNRDTVLEATHMAKYESMRQTAFAINKNKLMGDAN